MPPPLRFSFCTSLLFFTLSPLAFSHFSRLSHFSVYHIFCAFHLSPASLASHLSFTIPPLAYNSHHSLFLCLFFLYFHPSLFHFCTSLLFLYYSILHLSLLSPFLCLSYFFELSTSNLSLSSFTFLCLSYFYFLSFPLRFFFYSPTSLFLRLS